MKFHSVRFARPLLVSALLAVAFSPAVLARQAATTSAPAVGYTRLAHPTATTISLQTRSTKFVPESGSGPAVWLVGVAHIGEASYYQEIQKLLDDQGLVLFERVTRKAPAEPPKTSNGKPPTPVYQVMSDSLGLSFQMVAINYSRPTFKNSDLTWEQMDALASKQGKDAKSGLDAIGSILDPSSPQAQQITQVMGMAKSDPGMREGFRVLFAEALSNNPEKLLQGQLAGAGDVVITARNEKVFTDLADELKKPEPPKSIAIFYGAGHLADMEKRLLAMKYKPAESKWMTAINADESKVTGMGKTLVDMFRKQLAAARKGG